MPQIAGSVVVNSPRMSARCYLLPAVLNPWRDRSQLPGLRYLGEPGRPSSGPLKHPGSSRTGVTGQVAWEPGGALRHFPDG